MENLKPPTQTCNPLVDEIFFTSINISDEILAQILALPRSEVIRDLNAAINFAIDHFDEVQLWDNEEGDRTSFAFHAVFLLAELKAEESFPLLLKLCHCSDDLLDFYFGDYPTECMWQDALVLGFNQVAASVQFFKDGGGSFSGNCIVSDGLVQLYLHFPEKQEEVIEAFKELLDFLFYKNPDEDNHELNELVLNAVADLKNPILLPLCKLFYDQERTFTGMTGDWQEFEKIQFSNRSYKREFLTLRERLNYFERMNEKFESIGSTPDKFEPDFFDDFSPDYSEPLLPINTEPKIQRNEPCPCGSGLKYKKCCLNKVG